MRFRLRQLRQHRTLRVRRVGAVVCAAWMLGAPASARAAPPGEQEDRAALEQPEPSAEPSAEPSPEPAPEPSTAGEWYARGIELATSGDYAAAAAAFLRSYELRATPEALFNAAFAWEKAGAPIPAIATYERFLAEPSPTQEYIEPAQRSIEALMRSVGVLKGVRYHAERPPVELRVQGETVELDAFPLLVMPGNIEVEVIDAQGKHAREFYELLAGEALVVDLRALLPLPEADPDPQPDTDPPPPELVSPTTKQRVHARRAATLRKLTWTGIGLTGATALAAGTLGALALRERRLFEAQTCSQFPGMNCPSDFNIGDPQRHYELYGDYALTGTVLASVSGALAIGSLVVGLLSVRHERASHMTRHDEGRARVRLVPQVGGLALRF